MDQGSERSFPWGIAREDIRCDIDENLWPNAEDRVSISVQVCPVCGVLYCITGVTVHSH